MAIKDTPVQKQQTRPVKDAPLSVRVQQMHSEDTRDFMAVQSAFLDNYINGSDPIENYAKYKGSFNKEQILQQLSNQKASVDSSALTEEFVANPYGTTNSIEETAGATRAALNTARSQNRDPDRQYAEAISGTNVSLEKIEREAAQASMYKVLADFEEEVSFGDKTMDFLAGFAPGLSTFNGWEVTGDIWDQSEGVAQIIRGFKLQEPAVQERVFPVLRDELREKVGDAQAYRILEQVLQPTGGEEVDEFSNLETLLDAADLVGIGMLVGQFAKGVKQGHNLTKSMDRVGNSEGATDSVVASLADEDVRIATNQDEVTATGNALPFDISIEDPGHVNGFSGKAYNSLKEFFGEVDKTADEIMLGKGFLKEGIVGTRTRAELEEDVIRRFKAEQAEEIRVVRQDQNETIFSYKVLDENNEVTEQEYTMAVTLDDAGMWHQSDSSIIANYAGSPTWMAKTAELGEDVATAQRVDYLSGRISRKLTDLQLKALEPIGTFPTPKTKKSLAKVDNALIQGDEWKNADGSRGKVFKPDELKTHFGLNEAERSAYYRVNRLYNNLWRIRNHETRQEKIALGIKDVKFTRNGEHMTGEPFENAATASGSLRTSNTNFIYDADADDLVSVKNAGEGFFKKQYENDKVVVKLEDAYDIGNDRGAVNYALVNKDEVTDLPQVVLQRKEGYVPRIYESNVYFVKEIGEKVMDGDKTMSTERTLRFFDNKKEADDYIDQLIDDELSDITDPVARESLEKSLREKYQRRADREREILAGQAGDLGQGSGGLYTAARAQDDILFGLNGDKAQRVNTFEALSRNIGNISKVASINQWRLGLEQRWINTAKHIFKKKGLDANITKFSRLENIAEAVDEVRFLNRMYDQIRDWQNFPTESERFFQTTMQGMYDFAKGRGFNNTAKVLGNFRDADPVSAARATAFHSLLGWLNPAQMWVQAQGMSIAFSLGLGKYAGKAMADAMALRAVGMGATDGTRFALASKATKYLGLGKAPTPKELERMRELWDKTGYQDSVLQTADHAAASKGYGMAMGALKRAADRSLIFYRQGELMNRSFSFTTSIQRWLEKQKGAKTLFDITDDDLKNIMDDANNMMLNMTRANRAPWQKGLPSLPTQFLQVTTKFLETVTGLNGQFTKAERGRMILGQIGLYGTAGVPVLGMGTMLASEVFGMSQQEIEENPGFVKTVNDGFWGVVGHQMFGVDVEMSSRGSLLRGISDFVDNWFMQESTITEKLLGPFGSTQQNFVDSFMRQLRPFTVSNMGNIDFEDVGKLLTLPVLESISTWNNHQKAEFMDKMGALYSKRGRAIVEDDFDFMDQLAQRIGFQQTSLSDTYELGALNRAADDSVRQVVDDVVLLMNDFSKNHPNGDYTEEEFEEHMQNISVIYGWLDEGQKLDAIRSVKRILMGETKQEYEVSRYIQRTMEATSSQLSAWKSAVTGNKVLRFGTGEEEEE